MYLHCLACIWFLLVEQDRDWMPPLDYVFTVTTVYEATSAYQYWISLYHAVLMLTGNDVGPRGNSQVRHTLHAANDWHWCRLPSARGASS